MAIQDRNVVRTAADLEKKYNFSKLLGFEKNIETNAENLIRVENELNNMLNSLIINLGDVLDTQSSISLWFYSGVPTTSNKPYTDWATPSDHYGDLYYDQNSGYVYKYTNAGWVIQEDTNLVNAMALTNVELDVSADHERQVYFEQPTPPYSSGDWWILEDGTLMICQIGKPNGESYEEDDFVVSSKYTSTVAVKQDDTLTVLEGTVQTISNNAVMYTDLATHTTTTISGESITTGNIKSSNYVANTSGTKISLTDGTIDSKNFKLSNNGTVNCKDISIDGGDIIINGGTDDDPNFVIQDNSNSYPNKEGCMIPGYIRLNKNINSNVTSGIVLTSDQSGGNYDANAIALYTEVKAPVYQRKIAVLISSDESKGYIYLHSNNSTTIKLDGNSGNITCVSLTQTSKEESKKNIELYKDALNEILKTDIYKYNLITENDDNKKHLGFIIGKERNYSKEIVSLNDNGEEIGVDIYSMTSLCLQAIKEQQKQIEDLSKEIESLKKHN